MLYIKLANGLPEGHPFLEENLVQAGIDARAADSGFAPFHRVEQPETGKYQVASSTYFYDGVIAYDLWHVRDMTADEISEEKSKQISAIMDAVENAKVRAASDREAATSDEARQAWTDFIAELDAFECSDPDNVVLPIPPRVAEDGSVLSVNASGSAPNVVG